MIKQKRRKNDCKSGIVFELLEEGRNIAIRLKASLQHGPVQPGPLRQLASDVVDDVYGNVTLSMDFREGGGASRKLHDMCNFLDEQKIPYVVRNLKISDYGKIKMTQVLINMIVVLQYVTNEILSRFFFLYQFSLSVIN